MLDEEVAPIELSSFESRLIPFQLTSEFRDSEVLESNWLEFLSQTFNQYGSENPLAAYQTNVISVGRDCEVVNFLVS